MKHRVIVPRVTLGRKSRGQNQQNKSDNCDLRLKHKKLAILMILGQLEAIGKKLLGYWLCHFKGTSFRVDGE